MDPIPYTWGYDAHWYEADSGDVLNLNQPIFCLSEDEMGEELEVDIRAMDVDPDGLEYIGIHNHTICHGESWSALDGETYHYTAGDMELHYSLHAVDAVDSRHFVVEVHPIYINWDGDGSHGGDNPGDIYTWVKVFHGFNTSDGGYEGVRRRYPAREQDVDKHDGEYQVIGGSDGVVQDGFLSGSFVYVEVLVWDYDGEDNNDDQLGVFNGWFELAAIEPGTSVSAEGGSPHTGILVEVTAE